MTPHFAWDCVDNESNAQNTILFKECILRHKIGTYDPGTYFEMIELDFNNGKMNLLDEDYVILLSVDFCIGVLLSTPVL